MSTLSHISKALVVEDEALILMDVEQTLRDAGIDEVRTATSVEEAMNRLRNEGDFDVALLDLHLGRDGWSYEVARRLQQQGIPFAFSSGTIDVADGFRDVPLITKPFSTDQLLATLLQVTADRQSQAAQ